MKKIHPYIKTESLSDETRSRILSQDFNIFPACSLIHPYLSACIAYNNKKEIKILKKCKFFRFEEDQEDSMSTVICRYYRGNGFKGVCEKFVLRDKI